MTTARSNSPKAKSTTRRLAVWLLAISCALPGQSVLGQQRYLVEGIFDAEIYKTDADSLLLSRNDGDIASLGRLQLWAAFQISPGLQIYALGEAQTDNSGSHRVTEAVFEQYALRYTRQSSPYYFLEAGKILSPLAAYSDRHLSTQNPLIRQPYLLAATYPLGVQLAGSSGWFDYRAAYLDLPAGNGNYGAVQPDSSFRPALGFGVTPFTGLRFGITYTQGPFLDRHTAYVPPGTSSADFDQRVWGLDFQYSRGYLELNGQWVNFRYEVPYYYEDTDDTSWYLELKYTWTPRLYGAARFGKYQVSYIASYGETYGLPRVAPGREFSDIEIGLGYRLGSNVLFKVAYSSDHWSAGDVPDYRLHNGHSVGMQLSWHFDLGSMFQQKPR
ncbi:porin [Pseudomonadota bacterium]